MREDILLYLKEEMKRRCQSSGNVFGFSIYSHIREMVHNAIFLAKKYCADTEVVAIAAWLHDIASITDYALYGEHHIHGANMAGPILEAQGYPAEKIKQVQICILHHRDSMLEGRRSVEEQCVADADAISHFDCLPALFYQVYVQKGYSIDEGTKFVINKLEKSYHRLSAPSRELYQKKYENVMRVLSGVEAMDTSLWRTGYLY